MKNSEIKIVHVFKNGQERERIDNITIPCKKQTLHLYKEIVKVHKNANSV